MRLQRIIEQVYFRPWSITPEGFATVSNIVQSHVLQPSALNLEDFINPRKPLTISNGVAHIDVCGVLGSGLSNIEKTCGNTDYGDIEKEIQQATASGVREFEFSFDSPGGMCSGCIECGRAIAAITAPKVAVIGAQCCSAAYLLAAGCDRVEASDSSIVGSIGTLIPRVDRSGQWEQAGIKPDFITNTGGDLKSTGHGPSITDDQREFLQQVVDDMFAQFRDHVLTFRAIPPEAIRGQYFVGTRALQMNLIDKLR